MTIKIELDGFTFELREIQGGIQIFETTNGPADHIGEAPSCDAAILFLKNEIVPAFLEKNKQRRLKRAKYISSLLDDFKIFCTDCHHRWWL